MYLLLKDVHLRVLEILQEVASCLKVTNQNNGSEDQVDDTLATYIVTFILRQETMGNAARSHHVFVEQTNKKNWKKIHSYEIRRDLLLRRNVCNIQFCWSLSKDINNSYRRARTYSPKPSITLQNIHKSVINPVNIQIGKIKIIIHVPRKWDYKMMKITIIGFLSLFKLVRETEERALFAKSKSHVHITPL